MLLRLDCSRQLPTCDGCVGSTATLMYRRALNWIASSFSSPQGGPDQPAFLKLTPHLQFNDDPHAKTMNAPGQAAAALPPCLDCCTATLEVHPERQASHNEAAPSTDPHGAELAPAEKSGGDDHPPADRSFKTKRHNVEHERGRMLMQTWPHQCPVRCQANPTCTMSLLKNKLGPSATPVLNRPPHKLQNPRAHAFGAGCMTWFGRRSRSNGSTTFNSKNHNPQAHNPRTTKKIRFT
jgi:hypothetical protein